MRPLLSLVLLLSLAACDVLGPKAGPVSVAWSVPVTGRYLDRHLDPSTDGERVFILGNDLLALDAATGERLWEAQPVERFVAQSSTAHGGRVFVGSAVAAAVDAATGAILWRTPLPDGRSIGRARAGADDGAFYTVSNNGQAYAFDAETGAVRWQVDLAEGWWGVAAQGVTAADGVVYVAIERRHPPNGYYAQGVVVALDAQTGRELWRYVNGDASTSVGVADAPTVAGNLLLLADGLGLAFFALDRTSGRLRWRVPTTPGYVGPYQSPAVHDGGADGYAYASSSDMHAYTIELATGQVRWKREIAPDVSSPFYHAVCGDVVLHSAFGVYATDRVSGRTVGNDFYRRDDFTSRFAISGNKAFTVGRRTVVAFDCP